MIGVRRSSLSSLSSTMSMSSFRRLCPQGSMAAITRSAVYSSARSAATLPPRGSPRRPPAAPPRSRPAPAGRTPARARCRAPGARRPCAGRRRRSRKCVPLNGRPGHAVQRWPVARKRRFLPERTTTTLSIGGTGSPGASRRSAAKRKPRYSRTRSGTSSRSAKQNSTCSTRGSPSTCRRSALSRRRSMFVTWLSTQPTTSVRWPSGTKARARSPGRLRARWRKVMSASPMHGAHGRSRASEEKAEITG